MAFEPVAGRDQAKLLYIKGLTAVEIGTKLDINPDTIRKWVSRFKWGRQRYAIDALASDAPESIQTLAAERFVTRVLKQADTLLMALETADLPTTARDIKDSAIGLASIAATGRKALGLDNDSGPRSVSITILAEDAKRARIIDSDAQVQVQPEPPAQPTSSDQS